MSVRPLQCTNQPGCGMYGAGSNRWTYIPIVLIALHAPPKDVAVEGNDSKVWLWKPALEIRAKDSELGDQTCSLQTASLSLHPRGMFLGRSWTLCPYHPSQPHPPLSKQATVGTRYKKKESQLHSSESLKDRLVNLLTDLILESQSFFENISAAQTKKNKNLCAYIFFVVRFIKMKKNKEVKSKCLRLGKW